MGEGFKGLLQVFCNSPSILLQLLLRQRPKAQDHNAQDNQDDAGGAV